MLLLLQHTASFGDKHLSLKSVINVRSSCNSEQLTKYSDMHTKKEKTNKTLFVVEALFNLFEIVQQDSHTEGREGNSVFLDGGTILIFSQIRQYEKESGSIYLVPLVVHHVTSA